MISLHSILSSRLFVGGKSRKFVYQVNREMNNKKLWPFLRGHSSYAKLFLGLVIVIFVVACQSGIPPTAQVSLTLEATDDGEHETPTVSVNALWVDAVNGDDGQDGMTPATALRTIQRAADLATPGVSVHILPGIYRETVKPTTSGTVDEPILYLAENGPGTAIIRGSESSQSLEWTRLETNSIGLPAEVEPSNIYTADIAGWGLDGPPRFVVELEEEGDVVTRLPLAREPDWQVINEWKYHEFWWAADGGHREAGCNPATDPDSKDCDSDSRSETELTDRSDDIEPEGIEPGNLTTLGDLTGATLVAVDTKQGHSVCSRTIVGHDNDAGRITVDKDCKAGGDAGLGWGSKYYIENKPYLLDNPGEWWYDTENGRLYLWPLTAKDPSTLKIEISARSNGIVLKDRSHIILDGLTIEFLNGSAVHQSNNTTERSYGNTVRNALIRYANRGVDIRQSIADDPAYITDGFTIEDSEIAYIDTHGVYINFGWGDGSDPASFTHAGITNTLIQGNELHHLGFRSDMDNAIGVLIVRPDRLRFEDNHVHHVAQNGVQFNKSVIQSPNEWGFKPEEIKTGNILIKDNLFEKACQLTTDCGALKIWGSPPDEHVFRDVLITGNIFRDTFGWTYVSEARGRWSGGEDSNVEGMGGRGLYIDWASGIHAYRNIAYNNPFAGFVLNSAWRDGEIVYYNNIAANSLYGFRLVGTRDEVHDQINTQFVNNIIINNEGHGIWYVDDGGSLQDVVIDHNLYYNNGWRAEEQGGLYRPGAMVIFRKSESNDYFNNLAAIQSGTQWETNGKEGDPGFVDYDLEDHDLHDGSWPDFRITTDSTNVVDQGITELPTSLKMLLDEFDIQDVRGGGAYDIGRYEVTSGTSALPQSDSELDELAKFLRTITFHISLILSS